MTRIVTGLKIRKQTYITLFSAPVIATQEALAGRMQSVRETASLLHNRMIDNIRYGEERLNDIIEKKAREEEEETTEKEEQTEDEVDLTPQDREKPPKGDKL